MLMDALELCDHEQDEQFNKYIAAVMCLVEQFKTDEGVASFVVIRNHEKEVPHILNWLSSVNTYKTSVDTLSKDMQEAVDVIIQYPLREKDDSRLVCRVDFYDRILETSDDVVVYIKPEKSIRGALVYTRTPEAMAHIHSVKSWINWLHDSPNITEYPTPDYFKLKDVTNTIQALFEENSYNSLKGTKIEVEYNASVGGMVIKLVGKEK